MSATRNDITCSILKSKPGTVSDMQKYENGWDRIFGKEALTDDNKEGSLPKTVNPTEGEQS